MAQDAISIPPPADPLALMLFRLLDACDPDDRHLVLGELEQLFEPRLTPFGRTAVAALHQCAAETGQKPVRRRYAAWRDGHPDKEALPAPTTIARHFGESWWAAMAAAGFAVPVRTASRRLLATYFRATDEEMLEGLRLAARDLGVTVLRAAMWVPWVKSSQTARDCCPRLPVSVETYTRRFGSWDRGLELAGLPTRDPEAPRGANERYSDEHLLWALQTARAALNVPYMREVAYKTWVVEEVAEPEGPDRSLDRPWTGLFGKRFGSWIKAQHAAGTITDEQFDLLQYCYPKPLANGHAARMLLQARVAVGERLTKFSYTRWRDGRRDELGFAPAPDEQVLYRYYRSLRRLFDAIEEAFARDGSHAFLESWLDEHDTRRSTDADE